ncbi:MAG: type IV secretory system conjugative DNA transfer family protein [Christensenellaceae bacterium]|nr:type IV secretory system conjugative DNA transfer family protein [Christensenellaceae bacterium]
MSKQSSCQIEFKNKHKFPFSYLIILLFFAAIILIIAFCMDYVISLLDTMASNLLVTSIIVFFVVSILCGTHALKKRTRLLHLNAGVSSVFTPTKEIAKSSEFIHVEIKKLNKCDAVFPLRFTNHKGKLQLLLTKNPTHVKIIGSSIDNNSSRFIDPMIQIVARFKIQPSFVIVDPAGELYRKHSEYLDSVGYKVFIISYEHGCKSKYLNPFQPAIDIIKELHAPIKNSFGKYLVNGKNFDTYPEAEAAAKLFKQTLLNEGQNYLRDVLNTVFFNSNKKSQNFDEIIKNLILALVYALYDDLSNNLIKASDFCFHNIYHLICSHLLADDMTVLTEYIEQHKQNIICYSLAQPFLMVAESDLKFYNASISYFSGLLKNECFRSITSYSDFSFTEFDDHPCALFVIYTPDVKQQNKLVSLILNQTYFTFNKIADSNKQTKKLKMPLLSRPCYFVVNGFEKMTPLSIFDERFENSCLSGIICITVLENYGQLVSLYGEELSQHILASSKCTIITDTSNHELIKLAMNSSKVTTIVPDLSSENKPLSSSKCSDLNPTLTPDDIIAWKGLLTTTNSIIVSYLNKYCFLSSFLKVSDSSTVYKLGNSLIPETDGNIIFECSRFESSLIVLNNNFKTKRTALEIQPTPSFLNNEKKPDNKKYLLEKIEKTEKKIASLLENKDKSIKNIVAFLQNSTFSSSLLISPIELLPDLINDILKSPFDIILDARLNLARLLAQCERISTAKTELENLYALYQQEHPLDSSCLSV